MAISIINNLLEFELDAEKIAIIKDSARKPISYPKHFLSDTPSTYLPCAHYTKLAYRIRIKSRCLADCQFGPK